jgi:hypothetical protein
MVAPRAKMDVSWPPKPQLRLTDASCNLRLRFQNVPPAPGNDTRCDVAVMALQYAHVRWDAEMVYM